MTLSPTPLRFSVALLAAAYLPAADPHVPARPQPPKTPLALVDTANNKLNFTIAQVNDGVARFGVVNSNSTKPVRVAVQADTLVSFPGAPLKPQPLGTFSLTPASAIIQPGTAQTFTVNPLGAPLPGVYASIVRLIENGVDVLPPQTLVLTVPGPELLASKGTVTLFRFFPGSPVWREETFSLPVADPNKQIGVAGRPIGVATRDPGGFTTVRWGQNGKEILIDPPPSAGSYSGTLTLAKDPSPVTYALTVNAKDIFVWPLFITALGVLLAYVVRRYIGVIRVVWDLRLQEAQLGDFFKQNQRKFVESAEGRTFGGYSIAADVQKQRSALTQSIDAVESTPATTINSGNQSYQNALNLLKSIQAAIGSWPDFGESLAKLSDELDAAREAINGSEMEPPVNDPPPPPFLDDATKLLVGKALTIANVATVNQQVLAAGSLVESWLSVRQRAATLTQQFRGLSKNAGAAGQATQLENAQNLLIQVWTDLTVFQTAADLQALLASTGPLVQAEIQLDQIQTVLGASAPVGAMVSLTAARFDSDAAVAAPHSWFRSRADRHSEAADDRRADLLRRRIASADIATTVFAFGLALVTGLNTLYFSKPFGTLADYAGLFIWAAGTKATLDIVLVIADNFGIGITPAPSNAPAPAAPTT
jgi:hypothetical protein